MYSTSGFDRYVLRHKCANVEVELVVFLLFLVGEWLLDWEVDLFGYCWYWYLCFILSRKFSEDLVDRGIVVEGFGIGVFALPVPHRGMVELQLDVGVCR